MIIEIGENYVRVDGLMYLPETDSNNRKITVADLFDIWDGKTADSPEVQGIQKWYYGRDSRTPWCATSMSYMLANLGILQVSCGGRHENVFAMWQGLKKYSEKVNLSDMRRGDIVVMCWDEVFNSNSSKHITCFTGSPGVYIGGNQDGKICQKTYTLPKIYSIWRPPYEMETMKTTQSFPII